MPEIMQLIDTVLPAFWGCFSYATAYHVFAVIIMGFLTREDNLGVTSFMRSLALHPSRYGALIGFFRADSYRLDRLRVQWYRCVKEDNRMLRLQLECGEERLLYIGDGTARKHYGRRMPAITRQADYYTDSSHVSRYWGHFWGAIGVITEGNGHQFCTPLRMSIQGALTGLSSWVNPEQEEINSRITPRLVSHVVQIIYNAVEIAQIMGPGVLTLDRFFLTVPMLLALQELDPCGKLLAVVTRAKLNTVAYEDPPPRIPGKRGPNRKKGASIHLVELFKDLSVFSSADVTVYGKQGKVKYLVKDLLWGRKLYRKLRFVLVMESDGARSIFVSTNLSLTAVEIIEIYGHRFKIERCFRSLKQVVYGFMSRFWTKSMPLLNLYRKKGEPDELSQVTSVKDRKNILDTLEAYERFAAFASIALGIAQMVALTPPLAKTAEDSRYLRTKSDMVSEATVTYFLRHEIRAFVASGAKSRICDIIWEYQAPLKEVLKPKKAA